MSRHEARQKLARAFGATDIVTERGDDGVARIKDLTKGVGADSVLECVGTQESMMQAIQSTRPGGSIGYVGVPHGVQLDGQGLFFRHVRLHGGPAPVRRYLPAPHRPRLEPEDRSRQGLRPDPAPRRRRRGLPRDGHAPRHQDAAAPLTTRPTPPPRRPPLGRTMGRCDLHRSLDWRRRWRSHGFASWRGGRRLQQPDGARARATPTAARAWTRRRCPARRAAGPGSTCPAWAATTAAPPASRSTRRRAAAATLFIYFMGGGACWDASTCFVLNTSVHGPFGQAQWDGTGAPSRRARAGSRARHQPVPRR